jgi:glycosyltransferase involved in cell wall biosynthesis
VKLLFLLTQSLDYPSGLGRYWPLAKELVRLGHQVHIAALHPALESLPARAVREEDVEIRYVGPMHVRQVGHERQYYSPMGLGWAVMQATWGLTWQALLSDFDAIHLCKPHPMNGLAGLLGHWLRGRQLYLDCDDFEAESNRYSSKWQKRMVVFWEDRLPHLAKSITVNTRFTQKRLESLGYPAERIIYVPNGIDRQRFSNLDSARGRSLRAQLGLGEGPVTLYVGSLSSPSHPLDLLLDAFALVFSKLSSARLLIVGGGEDYARIGQQVQAMNLQDRVTLTGRVDPSQIPDYYLLGDVSVDPVHDDPTARARSPLKLFESMATGTPVLTSDVGDRREHLGGDQAGLLVPPGSADALAEGLLYLLDNPALRQTMGNRGQELAEQFYWDVQVHQFARVYEH